MTKNNIPFRKEFVYPQPDFQPLIYLVDQNKHKARQISDFLSSRGFKVRLASSPPNLNELNPDKKYFLILIWKVEGLNDFLPH